MPLAVHIIVSLNLWHSYVLSLIGRTTRENWQQHFVNSDLLTCVTYWKDRQITTSQNRTLILIVSGVIWLCSMYAIEDNIALVSKSATWGVPNDCYYYINNKVTAEFIAQLLQRILASRCTCQRQDTRGVHAYVIDLHDERWWISCSYEVTPMALVIILRHITNVILLPRRIMFPTGKQSNSHAFSRILIAM